MKIIILGDKYQKGSKSQGCAGLIKINNSTNILYNQYSTLKQHFPSASIFYVYGFDHKKLMMYKDSVKMNIDFIYNDQYEKYNECFSLSLARDHLDTNTLILSGYNVFSPSSFKDLDQNVSQVFIDSSSQSKIGCIANNGIVENIFYDLDNKIHSVYYLNKETSKVLKNILTSKMHNAFLFEAINNCINIGCRFKIKNIPARTIKNNKNTITTKAK